jgi:hypothetical protein
VVGWHECLRSLVESCRVVSPGRQAGAAAVFCTSRSMTNSAGSERAKPISTLSRPRSMSVRVKDVASRLIVDAQAVHCFL